MCGCQGGMHGCSGHAWQRVGVHDEGGVRGKGGMCGEEGMCGEMGHEW